MMLKRALLATCCAVVALAALPAAAQQTPVTNIYLGGIATAAFNLSNHLILTRTDGTTIDAGMLSPGSGGGSTVYTASGVLALNGTNFSTTPITAGSILGSAPGGSTSVGDVPMANFIGASTGLFADGGLLATTAAAVAAAMPVSGGAFTGPVTLPTGSVLPAIAAKSLLGNPGSALAAPSSIAFASLIGSTTGTFADGGTLATVQTTANSAQTTATAASSAAGTAQSAAAAAQTTATGAQATATGAATTAGTAQTAATAAAAAAATAQTAANNAQTAANAAATAAATAQSLAAAAAPAASPTITGLLTGQNATFGGNVTASSLTLTQNQTKNLILATGAAGNGPASLRPMVAADLPGNVISAVGCNTSSHLTITLISGTVTDTGLNVTGTGCGTPTSGLGSNLTNDATGNTLTNDATGNLLVNN